MSKHTPGEWKLRPLQKVSQPHGEAPTYRRRIMVDSEPPFTFVCTLDFGYGHPKEDEANARLIAQAPRMLTALNDAYDNLETLRRETADPQAGEIGDIMDGIKFAIRKARGG